MNDITNAIAKLMKEMARMEDTIMQSKLLAYCDKCGTLKRLLELEVKNSPMTTQPCPAGRERGEFAMLVRQDPPQLACKGKCEDDLMDSLLMNIKSQAGQGMPKGFIAISLNCAKLNHEGCGSPEICDCDCHDRGKIT